MKKIIVGMISVALVSGCSTTSVNDTVNEIVAEARPTNALPTNDNKQDNQTQNDSTFYEPSESLTATTSESLGIPAPDLIKQESPEPSRTPEPSEAPEPSETPEPLRSPDPLPTASPVASESPSESIEEVAVVYNTVSFVDSVEKCKVPDVWTGPASKGFPIRNNEVPYLGDVNVAVVPIDFSDAPGEKDFPISTYATELKSISKWADFYSSGKMQYNIITTDDWIRAPKNYSSYNCENCGSSVLFNELVALSSSKIDYSNVHYVYFLVPKSAINGHNGAFIYGAYRLNGKIVRVFTHGDTPGKIWSHVIHEVLHDQGFIGHGPANGSRYGIMMGQWGGSFSVLSWPSFMAGWYESDDILCADVTNKIIDNIYVRVESLDKNLSGIKSVILRTGNTSAIVVEYRTDGPFSPLAKRYHGITAYKLDTSIKPNRCDSCGPQEYEDRKNWWNYYRLPNTFDPFDNSNIAFQQPGLVLDDSGIKIELIEDNLIKISQ